ncbi:MAG: hypothetical protein H6696_02175 [Deferribacteres bacterium]|nr:hypothetical protein [Deferribacteres bacterium]
MEFKGSPIVYAIKFYLLILLFSGCAAKQKVTVVYVPAGVDSTIAFVADSLAKDMFVNWKDEELAQRLTDSALVTFRISDSLLEALMADTAAQGRVSAEDSIASQQNLRAAARDLQTMRTIGQNGDLTLDQRKEQIGALLESAKDNLEHAITLNKFDRRARNALARVYENLAKLYQQDHYWGKSIESLSKLIMMDQSQHSLYARLASSYRNLKAWERALENYQLAEVALRGSAVYDVPQDVAINDSTTKAALDSTQLFNYVMMQSICSMRLYREQETFALLDSAAHIATTPEHEEYVQGYYDWAMWDDGKLETADRRDTLRHRVLKGLFVEAAEGYEVLLPNLRTTRAAQEIKWRLAEIWYSELSRKEDALNLMRDIIEFYQNDSTGMALAIKDSMLIRYRDNYGVMCYNTGAIARDEERDKVKALKYFMQSAATPWNGQAKAYLAVAQVGIHNPGEAEKAAKSALQLQEQLTDQEYISTMEILVSALRRQRKFKEATDYFTKWQELVRK